MLNDITLSIETQGCHRNQYDCQWDNDSPETPGQGCKQLEGTSRLFHFRTKSNKIFTSGSFLKGGYDLHNYQKQGISFQILTNKKWKGGFTMIDWK